MKSRIKWYIGGLIIPVMTFCNVCFAEELTTIEYKGVTLNIPSSWEERNSDDSKRYFYPESGMLMLQFIEGNSSSDFLEAEYQNSFAQGVNETGVLSIRTKAYDYIGDALHFRYAGFLHTDEVEYGYIDGVVVNAEGGVLNVSMGSFYDTDYSKEFENILGSITEVSSSDNSSVEIPDTSNMVEDNNQEAPAESTTRSRENALASAKDYLDFSAFSRSGLIEQLEYEGFSTEDATFAVDNCGADWFEQAYKSAEEYLSYSSFSHSRLVDQLIYEGFTQEEAEYGVSKTGL